MHTDYAKKIAQRRTRFLKDFLDELELELSEAEIFPACAQHKTLNGDMSMDNHEEENNPAVAQPRAEGASANTELEVPAPEATHFCSFCSKSHIETQYMIAAEFACICDECVSICEELIQQRRKEKEETSNTIQPREEDR
jgi:hypothetical protein